jgi:hypothetical protein
MGMCLTLKDFLSAVSRIASANEDSLSAVSKNGGRM